MSIIRVTRRYEFAASHRLHLDQFTERENNDLFGKCNNPFGHGHDYEIFVTVRGPVEEATGRAVDPARLDALVEREVVSVFHHKNMNMDVAAFAKTVPTTENLAVDIGRRLTEHWHETFTGAWPVLEKVRIRETDRNIFELTLN